ncbi:mitochondrial 39-S ribosomal protein L47 (MRP-L47)-domain-containing protein [Chytridium lagenaria]|nr:mitochondrial 39-S ribosomal protein L47 (MRP-L47)-domain-containing protein [Chytridium lagenaria]
MSDNLCLSGESLITLLQTRRNLLSIPNKTVSPITTSIRSRNSTTATAAAVESSAKPVPEIPSSASVSVGSGRGLLDFFDSEKGWSWRENEKPTGRAWTAAELRGKSFEDLHRLWWVCLKEINLLESQRLEAFRFRRKFPHDDRVKQVRLTMRRVKVVLWERRIAYLQSQAIVKLEVTRRELFDKEIEAVRLSRPKVAPIEPAASPEAPASEEAAVKENTPDWVEITPAMRQRVEAKLKEMFPQPIHEIGRKGATTAVSEDDGKGLKFVSGRGKRAKFGRRWYIL